MSQYSFGAEIPKLMKMIIHNFYSSKDIFIRELISNSSDALDKLKHKSLDKSEYIGSFSNFDIKIKSDKSSNTLTIEDSGIGMTKEDLVNCLGTIAKSGTEEFAKNVASVLANTDSAKTAKAKSDFIGQFGVGFYSAFLVADKVQVYTKHPESDVSYLWESDAISGYTISEVESNNIDLKRGTRIVLHIKADQTEYLDDSKLSDLIKKHSGFVSYPIYISKTVEVTKEVPDDSEEAEEAEESTEASETESNSNEVKIEDVTESKSKSKSKPKTKTETTTETKLEQLNTEPIWVKSPSEVSNAEYEQFYKAISSDFDTYSKVKHFKAEGDTDFVSILFCPKRAPFDMFGGGKQDKTKSDIKLYVKKVLITDKCLDLYPEYFSFVKGIVDCNDLPLNASRELLQKSKVLKQISKTLVKKTIEMFTELAESEDDYKLFYNEFGKNIKFAIHEDRSNREKLLELVRYHTSKSNDEQHSLAKYVERMLENQPGIYYINSDSLTNAESHPLIEKLKSSGVEVIYMAEPIDEYLMQSVESYKDKKFINVAKDELKLSEFIKSDTKSESDSVSESGANTDKLTDSETKEICALFKTVLGDLVEKVVVSDKLVSQPAIVTSAMGVSANMERIVKAQALGNDQMLRYMSGRKVLEINPNHNLIKKLKSTKKVVVTSPESVTKSEAVANPEHESADSEEDIIEKLASEPEVNDFEASAEASVETKLDKSEEEYIKVIYQMSLLAGGYQLENMNDLLSKLYGMIDYKNDKNTNDMTKTL
jgi:molecular chaperone HtpG